MMMNFLVIKYAAVVVVEVVVVATYCPWYQ
jgi:hypothetical protein